MSQNTSTNNSSSIVSKIWAFCNTLRDDGVGYGDYLEQLTYLLFLKMADEYSKPPHNRAMPIPKKYAWPTLTNKSGTELKDQDQTSLDITWFKDKSLADLDNLPDPDELAVEIIENLEAGLESFREVLSSLNKKYNRL